MIFFRIHPIITNCPSIRNRIRSRRADGFAERFGAVNIIGFHVLSHGTLGQWLVASRPDGGWIFVNEIEAKSLDEGAATVTVKQLGPSIGAEIHGLDATKPLNQASVRTIRDALMEHGVLVFRDQDITRQQQAAFAAHFGTLTIHPISPHLEELPEMIVLDNDGENPPLSTDVWHSDETFRLEPPMGTVLRAVIVPRVGGDTLFCGMTAAFEGLSDHMQRFVSGLEATHDFKNFKKLYGTSAEHRQRLWELEDRFPNPVHIRNSPSPSRT